MLSDKEEDIEQEATETEVEDTSPLWIEKYIYVAPSAALEELLKPLSANVLKKLKAPADWPMKQPGHGSHVRAWTIEWSARKAGKGYGRGGICWFREFSLKWPGKDLMYGEITDQKDGQQTHYKSIVQHQTLYNVNQASLRKRKYEP